MVDTDHVTGLRPRSELESWFASSTRRDEPSAALLADVVGLKAVNERGGFAAGDAVLRAAADRLRDATAGAVLQARLGGDELIAIFAGPDAEPLARAAAERLRDEAGQPMLRAAATVIHAGELSCSLIDRLYATLRQS